MLKTDRKINYLCNEKSNIMTHIMNVVQTKKQNKTITINYLMVSVNIVKHKRETINKVLNVK